MIKGESSINLENSSLEELTRIVKESNSYRHLTRNLSKIHGSLCSKSVKRYIDRLEIDTSHFTISVPGNSKYKTHIGKKFGKLTIKSIESKNKNLQSLYYANCLCDCGKEHECLMTSLTKGLTRSCGCLRKELTKEITSNLFASIKAGAKNRKIPFNLTRKEMFEIFIDQNRKCAISGLDIDFGIVDDKKTRTASLDRIDNTEGYYYENVQWVHKTFNFMRGRMSVNNFILACQLVVDHSNGKIPDQVILDKWR
jgi:hypothetical protein